MHTPVDTRPRGIIARAAIVSVVVASLAVGVPIIIAASAAHEVADRARRAMPGRCALCGVSTVDGPLCPPCAAVAA